MKRASRMMALLVLGVVSGNVSAETTEERLTYLEKEVLDLNVALTGVLVSAEGAGAFIGALALSVFARSEHTRYYYLAAVLTYCIFALAFSLSTLIWLSTLLLLAVGIVSAGFGAMQSALVLMNSPKGFERPMMGVLLLLPTATLRVDRKMWREMESWVITPTVGYTVHQTDKLLVDLYAAWLHHRVNFSHRWDSYSRGCCNSPVAMVQATDIEHSKSDGGDGKEI